LENLDENTDLDDLLTNHIDAAGGSGLVVVRYKINFVCLFCILIYYLL
jgi:hypothetical protein